MGTSNKSKSSHISDQSFDYAFSKGNWKTAREIIERQLKNDPDNHYLLANLSTTYYEEREYEKAYELIRDAFVIEPDCPLVLWNLAGSLEAIDRKDEAIVIWQELVNRGVKKVASGRCNEGIDWAKSLLADSKYRLGQAYEGLHEKEFAVKYLEEYLVDIGNGVNSIYGPNKAKEKLVVLKAV